MEIEREVKKMTLGHDFGAGAACLKCKDKCEGFELHFWRKICRNCKCGLADHNVQMNSEENKKVGKLFEDTKYTGLIAKLKKDGLPTYKGNMITVSLPSPATAYVVPPSVSSSTVLPPSASSAGAVQPSATAGKVPTDSQARGLSASSTSAKANALPVAINAASASVVPVKTDVPMQSVTYEWAPPVPNQYLAVRYIELLPPEKRPVVGTEGAAYRRQQMARQLPEHDQDPSMCHELSPAEVKKMEQYVRKYKDEALGVGDIRLPEEMALTKAGSQGGVGAGGPGAKAGGTGPGTGGAGVGGAGYKPGAGVAAGGAGANTGSGVGVGAGDAGFGPKAGAGVGVGYGPGVRVPNVAAGASSGQEPANGGRGTGGGGTGPGSRAGLASSFGVGTGETESRPINMGTTATAGALSSPGTQQTGQQQTFSCHHCQQAMRQGEPAVYAERAGYDKLWHPACFVCCTCTELLVDMIYFWKKGKLFCGRHYGDSERPRCGGCDELIFSNEYTQAEGQNWHLKHFCCFDCDCILAGETYVMEKDNPVCKPCYMKNYAMKCTACQNPLEPEAQRVSYGEHHWHAEPQCFQCSCCSKGLVGQRFMAQQGFLFCSVECKKKTMA
ncbi:testin [Lampris incognitus]|uniref:testin n=1 Tax=Lampris incognitus TaxID=2546036 RepID=UPI0024B600E5|nr:testin [Lampris incognitus]